VNARAIFASVLTICFAAIGLADDMGKNQNAKTFKGTSRNTFELNYLFHLPAEYDPRGAKRWPLILFLHGAGERGTNLSKVAVHGPPKIVRTNANFAFILVSPQCPSGQTWSEETLLGLLDDIIEKHKVDERRVYLTGLSMGGYGTWSLGLKYPKRFAAIAPICGGGDLLPILLPATGNQAALKRLPIWAFHGGKDDVVPPTESERLVNALKRAGNTDVKLTVYPEAGHDSWTATYNNPELYEWFLQHQRPSTAAK
jgi:predicted peptidase